MERLKNGWDEKFLEKTHYSAKGLRNNARRFKKKRKGSRDLQNLLQIIEEPKHEGENKMR